MTDFSKLAMDVQKLRDLDEQKRELGKLLQRQNNGSSPSEFAVIMPQRLSPEQAACYINMSTVWLQRGRSYSEEELRQREGRSYIPRPRYIRLSPRRIRYSKDDLDRWMVEFGCGQ